jgi:hypothetical protein
MSGVLKTYHSVDQSPARSRPRAPFRCDVYEMLNGRPSARPPELLPEVVVIAGRGV